MLIYCFDLFSHNLLMNVNILNNYILYCFDILYYNKLMNTRNYKVAY